MGKNPKFQALNRRVFERIQKDFATAGITPSLTEQSYPFNGTVLFGFFTICAVIWCTFVFIVYEADTFGEYTQCVCACSFAILIVFVLLTVILKVKKLFKLIESCDALVNSSECSLLLEYIKLDLHPTVFIVFQH